ncbi:MAG: hypothetical protein JNJ56_02020 [Ignavibacteria bacterium]|nr:hypothetical protein [Ignavibacteria bacterium]
MRKSILLFVILTILATAFLNGCGDKNEVKEEKKTGEKSTSGIESKNESAGTDDASKKEAEKSADENKLSNELGMTPGIPKDFPEDVPKPKNSKTLGSLNSSDGTVVTFESGDKVTDIVSFYKEEMSKNGFTVSEAGETLVSDKGGLINWTKDKREVGLMLGYDKDRNITSLVITYK